MKVGLYSISCSGAWFKDRPPLTVEEFIDTAKKFGYDGVEIDLKRPHGSPLDLGAKRCQEIRGYAEKQGMEIYACSANNNFASPVPEWIENELLMVREQIRVTKELGAKALRLFAAWKGIVMRNGIASYEIADETYFGSLDYEIRMRVTECLREAAKWAEAAGVTLALQNHHPVIDTYHDMLDFVNWVGSPYLKCCFDAPCCGWTEKTQSTGYITQAVRDVGKLQVLSHANAEFAVGEGGKIDMIPWSPKHPVLVNYPAFVRTLKEVGYDGYLGYEFCHMPFHNGRVYGYDEYIEDQIRIAQIYFRDLINNA